MRSAISPRLAISSFLIVIGADLLDDDERLVELDRLGVGDEDLAAPCRPWARGSGSSPWVSEYQSLPELDANANVVAIQSLKLENEGWERDYDVAEPSEPSFVEP